MNWILQWCKKITLRLAQFRRKNFFLSKESSLEDTIRFKRSKSQILTRTPPVALIVVKGSDQGREFILFFTPMKIGRGVANHIRLKDTGVSREHAVLEYDSLRKGFFLKDLGSKNGTYVNSLRIKRKLISPGDEIRVGASVFEVVAHPATISNHRVK